MQEIHYAKNHSDESNPEGVDKRTIEGRRQKRKQKALDKRADRRQQMVDEEKRLIEEKQK